ncbi:MAG TPA: DUF2254 domain-containing protein [Alphaproteobacteria bacterium]|nr:DUF2254 domain-containing protein [Alphaproteobacteria bacterium]
MITKWQWTLLQFARKLWVRATLIGLFAVAVALAGLLGERLIPADLPAKIGADAVESILSILASSMLAVTTFSLSVMVAAYSAATTSVTPRATKLLMQDATTQNTLAVFIGSFLFSLVSIVALSAGAYGESGRLILFVATLAVILLIVITILRWIEHLTRLGRVGETTDRVERSAAHAIRERASQPYLGGHPLRDAAKDLPASALPVYAATIGYVQHIDMRGLAELAERTSGRVFVAALPGSFVHGAQPIAYVESALDEPCRARLRDAFIVGNERSFDQDPRFGLSVLAEIASRALSPALNDPGTAIDVIGRGVRLLSLWTACREADAASVPEHPRIWVPPLALADLFDDIFAPIARDGAANLEVQSRLQKACRALAEIGGEAFAAEAERLSRRAMAFAETAMALDSEKTVLRRITL